MRLSSREKIMLVLLVIVLLGYLYYNFLLKPQYEKIVLLSKQVEEYDNQISTIRLQSSPNNKVYSDFKVLNAKIQLQSEKLFPFIIQEKIVEALDHMIVTSGLTVNSITFSAPGFEEVNELELPEIQEVNVLEELTKAYTKGTALLGSKAIGSDSKEAEAETKKEEKKDDVKLEEMTANLSIYGNYNEIILFLQNVELYGKRIIVKTLNIASGDNSMLNGTISLSFYTFPKLKVTDDPYLEWNYENEYGKDNPFEAFPGYVGASKAITGTGAPENTIAKKSEPDFSMSVYPASSDFPSVILGKADDRSGKSYLYADNAGYENVELHFIKNGDKYYYRYKTQSSSYPVDYSKEKVEFVPFDGSIDIQIATFPRKDLNDKNGVNLTVINETTLTANIKILNDDKSSPRVKVVKQSGNVSLHE